MNAQLLAGLRRSARRLARGSKLAAVVPATATRAIAVTPRAQNDMDDDFKPKYKVDVDDQSALMEAIEEEIKSSHVMLFMKGTPEQPMCGFSMQVSKILQLHGVEFHSFNVLQSPAVREGIKKFSDWPTIPQLYVDGEFVGGCDIVTQMHQSGELEELLKPKEAATQDA